MTLNEERIISRRKKTQNIVLFLIFPLGAFLLLGSILRLMAKGLILRLTPDNNDFDCRIGIGGCCCAPEEPCVAMDRCCYSCCCNPEEPCVTQRCGSTFVDTQRITLKEKQDTQVKTLKWLFRYIFKR